MRIETPELIGVDLELAGLGSRFVAQVVDWFWKGLASFFLLAAGLVVMAAAGHDNPFANPSRVLLAVVVGVLYCLWLGSGVYFELRHNGQTPGKRFAGIRVVSRSGGPIDFRAAAVRNLLAVADFVPVGHLLGAVLILLTKDRQRLGDLAAGTVVVRERVAASGPDTGDELTELASDEYAFTPAQLAALDASDRAVIRSFLQRYRRMDRRGRERLALKMADAYVRKTDYPLAEPLVYEDEAIAFLASLFRDLEEHRRHG